jgi:hypothetical protein
MHWKCGDDDDDDDDDDDCANDVRVCVCVCETYIGKPIGTRVVPQFTTEVAKPLTQ